MKQKISVRAFIKKGDSVLFLRRVSGNPKYIGQFELPGGKVDFGESPELAVRREVREEIGLDPGAVQLERIASWVDTMERATQHIIILYAVGLTEGHGPIVLSDEHDKFVWKKLSDVHHEKLNILTQAALQEEGMVGQTEVSEHVEVSNVDVNTTKKDIEVTIYADGGSRGNPGPSASGFVMYSQTGEELESNGQYLGITTNNQAEYHAVELGLKAALKLGATIIHFNLDSQLVVNQLTGVYQIKNRDLWPIHASIKNLMVAFNKVTFTHVRREFNQAADSMVNKTLDQHAKR